MIHYQEGYVDVRGRPQKIAWMDFAEDVHRSVAEEFDDKYGVPGVAELIATTRGAEISYSSLADEDDVFADEMQNKAAADKIGFIRGDQRGLTRESISITGAETRGGNRPGINA